MTPRRLVSFAFALAASVALAGFASADDAQNAAAAAAAQAVGQAAAAGGTATGGAAAVGVGASSVGSGHFQRALGTPEIPRVRRSAARKKSKSRRRSAAARRAAESKYKSRVIHDDTDESFLFNANGDPTNSTPRKKKTALKHVKKSSSNDADKPGACSTDEPCTVNNSDANAL